MLQIDSSFFISFSLAKHMDALPIADYSSVDNVPVVDIVEKTSYSCI